MTKNVYECMFILDSNRYARDPNGVASQIPEMIERCGGEVLVSRLWTEQKLAYPIQGRRKGVYWLAYFRMEGGGVSGLNRACQLHEAVLRHLVLRVDPRLVDALVAHARGESAPAEAAEGPPAGGPIESQEEAAEEVQQPEAEPAAAGDPETPD